MEANPTSDDKDTPGETTPSRPAVPLANLLGVRAFGRERGFGAENKEPVPAEKSLAPPLRPVVSIEMPRAETAPEPAITNPEPVRIEQPVFYASAERPQAEADEDDEADDAAVVETPEPISSEPSERPSPVAFVASERQPEPTPRPPVAPAFPDRAFFSRQTQQAAPEAPTVAPSGVGTTEARPEAAPMPPEEPTVAWHREMPPRPEAVSREAVPPHEHSVPQHEHPEIRRLRRNQNVDLLLLLSLGAWFNHKLNKQHRQEQEALKEVRSEQEEQSKQSYYDRLQILQQGRNLDQLNYAHRRPQFERPPPPPGELEYLRQRAIAEQARPVQSQAKPEQTAAEGNLQPGYHIERTWYDEMVDRDGRVVQGAMEHGRAYHEERQAEQAGYRFARYDPNAGGQQVGGGAYPAGHPGQTTSVDPKRTLEDGISADEQHRLGTGGPLSVAVRNPWIWVGLAILLLAFFTAAAL